MAVYDELVRELEADPSRREALRAILLSEELLSLPNRFAAFVDEMHAFVEEVHAFVAEMRAFVAETNRRLGSLESDVSQLKVDVSQLKVDVSQLKVDVSQLKVDVSQLKVDVGQLTVDVGRLKGSDLEHSWREKAHAYLGKHFRRLATLTSAEISALLDDAVESGRIDLDDLADAAHADAIIRGLRSEDRQPTYVVVEASWTLASSDLIRARRRAEIVQRATGIPAVAVAGGAEAPAALLAEASQAAVLVFTDGRVAA